MKQTVIFMFILLAVFMPATKADEIVLTNGSIYRNVQVIEQTDQTVTYLTNTNRKASIPADQVKNVLKTPFDPTIPSNVFKPNQIATKVYTTPYINNLAYSIPAAVLAFDYFKQADDVQNLINTFKDAKMDYKELEAQKTRRIIVGSVLALFTAYNTVYSLQRVEITTKNDMIGLAVHF